MIRRRHWNRSLDKLWLADTATATLLLLAPVYIYALSIFLGLLPDNGAVWAAVLLASGILIAAFFLRAFKWIRRDFRPIDRTRDQWASEHQSVEYKIEPKKERR